MSPQDEQHDQHERFMRLFLAHEPAILRSVLVVVPQRHDARDIVQETAVALWSHFGEFDAGRPFVNWACGFARMEARRFLRRSQRRAVLSEQAVVALLATEQADAGWLAERERHLPECREQLPSEHRRILDGYYVDESSVGLLAERHGRSAEAIYKLLQRTRQALVDCMERKTAEAGK
jgi:RNA polymerase sigma-70 factor (ECF subfamily)